MNRNFCLVFLLIAIAFFPGCSTIKVDPQIHKATILYLEGGSGEIKHYDFMLFNRCYSMFHSKGIKISYMNVSHADSFKGLMTRLSHKHTQDIQKKVDNLKTEGHERSWLMGLSNGTLSVMHAGISRIKGIEGLIIVNPRKDMYSEHTRDGTFVKFSLVELPVLLVTHARDNSNMKGLSPQFFKRVFRSSPMAQIIVLSGGRVGSGAEATHSSQKYQHGLMGKEKVFVRVVADFIDRCNR